MNRFKAFLIVTMLFLMLHLLTSCIIIPVSTHYDIDVELVESIDIFDLHDIDTTASVFLETEVPFYTLAEDQFDPFLEALSDIDFERDIILVPAAVDPGFHFHDWTVCVNYKDGFRFCFSCAGYAELLDENSQAVDCNHYGCEEEEWMQLITNYLPKSTEEI